MATVEQIRAAAVQVQFRGRTCQMIPTEVAWGLVSPEVRKSVEVIRGETPAVRSWAQYLAHYQNATPDLAYVGLWVVLPVSPAEQLRRWNDMSRRYAAAGLAASREIGEFEPHDWL